jgi:hypothetical protein
MRKTKTPLAANESGARPNPIPFREIPIDDDTLPPRQMHCRRYGACVSFGSVMEWDSFSCAECSAFEPLAGAQEERERPLHEDLGKFIVGVRAHRVHRMHKEMSR